MPTLDIPFELKIVATLVIPFAGAAWVRIAPQHLYAVYRLLLTLSLTNSAWYFSYMYTAARRAHINNDFESMYTLTSVEVLRALLPSLVVYTLLYVLALVFVRKAPKRVSALPLALNVVNVFMTWSAVNRLIESRGLYSAVLFGNGEMFNAFSLVVAIFYSLLLLAFFLVSTRFQPKQTYGV